MLNVEGKKTRGNIGGLHEGLNLVSKFVQALAVGWEA